MQFRGLLTLFAAAAATLASGVGFARADFNDLTRRVPMDANVIVLINVEKILASPLGQKEGWKDKLADNFAEKPMVVPPGVTRLVLGSQLDPTTLQPQWEVSIMDLQSEVSVDSIAVAERGFVDNLAGKPAAYSPINAYFVQLKPRVLAAVAPANRQFTARWARNSDAMGSAFLSDYLKNAALAVDKSDYVLAIDLTDVASRRRVENRIKREEFTSLAGKKDQAAALADTLASIKGLTLTVEFAATAKGRCVIDFGKDAGPLASVGKNLLCEMLARGGADFPDVQRWKFTASGAALVGEGSISLDGLRMLFSIVDPPTPLQPGDASPQGSPGSPTADNKAMAAASQKYYKTIAAILDKMESGAKDAPSMSHLAAWMRRDARRIARLPILNVDPDLMAWGSEVSTRLTDVATIFSTGGLGAQARTTGVTSTYSDTEDEGGYYFSRAQQDTERRNADRVRMSAAKEEQAKTLSQAAEQLNALRTARNQIRATMTQRYKVDF